MRRFRQLAQLTCFVLFCVLMFYVASPYPERVPIRWNDWIPLSVDGTSGEVVLSQTIQSDATDSAVEPILLRTNAVLWLSDTVESSPVVFGDFCIQKVERLKSGEEQESDEQQATELQLTMAPVEALSGETLDLLATTFEPLSISNRQPGLVPDHFLFRLCEKSFLPPYLFLAMDPTAVLTTLFCDGVRPLTAWLLFAGAIFASVLLGRLFCGWICPLGAIQDFVGAIGSIRLFIHRNSTVKKGTVCDRSCSGWLRVRYCVLAIVIGAAVTMGVNFSGWFAPIPMLTRNMELFFGPFQTAYYRGWLSVPNLTPGAVMSILIFATVIIAGILTPRFFCRYLCPSGTVFSLLARLRFFGYRINPDTCSRCGKCIRTCGCGAIVQSGSAVAPVIKCSDCISCGNCSAVCPKSAITLLSVNKVSNSEVPSDSASPTARRQFLRSAVGTGVAVTGGFAIAAGLKADRLQDGTGSSCGSASVVIRPPGSVPERDFLARCIRCGECLRACPNSALEACSLSEGLEQLWTPRLEPNRAGCESACANCGHVCPTGAISSLTIEQKRQTKIGLAVVDAQTCLPLAGKQECQLCYDECAHVGYNAIEFRRVGVETDADGQPIEDSGYLAPAVLTDKCIGCGLCQTRCYLTNVQVQNILSRSAITIQPIRLPSK